MKKAICLLSGGLDSATALYAVRAEGYEVAALTLHYGQRHEKEIACARALAAGLGIKHHVIPISLPWKASALLDPSMAVPTGRSFSEMSQEIPVTYVPARNTIFLSFAASWAEAAGAQALVIGANALDYSGYPDCRPEYLHAFEALIRQGTKTGVEGRRLKVLAPLLHLSKKEIILLAERFGVAFEKTWSCYQGREVPCGECDSCKLRAKGFQEAGIEDPLIRHAPSPHR